MFTRNLSSWTLHEQEVCCSHILLRELASSSTLLQNHYDKTMPFRILNVSWRLQLKANQGLRGITLCACLVWFSFVSDVVSRIIICFIPCLFLLLGWGNILVGSEKTILELSAEAATNHIPSNTNTGWEPGEERPGGLVSYDSSNSLCVTTCLRSETRTLSCIHWNAAQIRERRDNPKPNFSQSYEFSSTE